MMTMAEVGYPDSRQCLYPEQLRDFLVGKNKEILIGLEDAGHDLGGLTVMIVVIPPNGSTDSDTSTSVY